MPKSLYNRIYAVVRRVPFGKVTTYGAIARVVGCPARVVGFALAALPAGHDLPWHRVVNGQGKVSPRADGDGSHLQRLLLEREGLRFDHRQRLELERFHWDPGVGTAKN